MCMTHYTHINLGLTALYEINCILNFQLMTQDHFHFYSIGVSTESVAERWGMGIVCLCSKMCSNGGRASSTQSSVSPALIGQSRLPYQRQDLAKADSRDSHTHTHTALSAAEHVVKVML